SRTSDAARDEQSTLLAKLLTVLSQYVQLDTTTDPKTAAVNSHNPECNILDVPEHLCAPVIKMFEFAADLTDMPESNVVRGLLRLDELLRHICNACHRLVGDQALGLRIKEARMAVHRDLVCAPSLYISEDFTCKPEASV
ncbi:hypothetical protein PHET_11500, partial [Paragonimus heterotremus]